MRCTVFVIVILSVRLSVRPSVCLSVTLVDCVHMVQPTIIVSSPYGSPIILVSADITFIPKFEEGHPERGRWMRVEGTNWRLSTNKPPYLRNGARYDKGYYWSLMENRIRALDWYLNQRPWLTLKWPWTAIMHSVALHTCVSEPTTKICMKIDTYYQRQKCSPETLVSSKVSFMRIFAGVRWGGDVKWEWGGRKWRFSLLSLTISSEPSHPRPHLLCTML